MHVVTANEMYEIDRYTIEKIGLPDIVLMENAGRAFAEKAKSLVRKDERLQY